VRNLPFLSLIFTAFLALNLVACGPANRHDPQARPQRDGFNGTTGFRNADGVEYVHNGDPEVERLRSQQQSAPQQQQQPQQQQPPPQPSRGTPRASATDNSLVNRLREFEISRYRVDKKDKEAERFGDHRYVIKVFLKNNEVLIFRGQFAPVDGGFAIDARANDFTLKGEILDWPAAAGARKTQTTSRDLTLTDVKRSESVMISYRAYRANLKVRRDRTIQNSAAYDEQIRRFSEKTFGWFNKWNIVNGPSFYLMDIVKMVPAGTTTRPRSILSVKGESLAPGQFHQAVVIPSEDSEMELPTGIPGDAPQPSGPSVANLNTKVFLVGNQLDAERRIFEIQLTDDRDNRGTSDSTMRFALDVEMAEPELPVDGGDVFPEPAPATPAPETHAPTPPAPTGPSREFGPPAGEAPLLAPPASTTPATPATRETPAPPSTGQTRSATPAPQGDSPRTFGPPQNEPPPRNGTAAQTPQRPTRQTPSTPSTQEQSAPLPSGEAPQRTQPAAPPRQGGARLQPEIPPLTNEYIESDLSNPRVRKMISDYEQNRDVPGVLSIIKEYLALNAKGHRVGKGVMLQNFFDYANPFRKLLATIGIVFQVSPAFVYLNIVESRYFYGGQYEIEPGRGSTALGPFQITSDTALGLKLRLNAGAENDERRFLAPSACAAALYLGQLADGFSDSTLAILGYNQGPAGAAAFLYCNFSQNVPENQRKNCTSRINAGMTRAEYNKSLDFARRYDYTYKELERAILTAATREYLNRKLAVYFIASDLAKYEFSLSSNAQTQRPANTMPTRYPIMNPTCRQAVAAAGL